MRKLLLSSLLIVFAVNVACAGDTQIVKILKSRTLIVKKMSEDPNVVRKLKKDFPKLAVYRKNIKESNALLKKTVASHWKHHSVPIFKTANEIETMKEEEKEKKKKLRKAYTVLSMDFFSENHATREASAVKTDKMYTGDALYLYLRFWEGDEIVYTSIPHVIPTASDMVYAVRYLSNQVKGMEFGKNITDLCEENGPQVRTKTLLVTAFQVSELKEKDLLKVYPYQYKVVKQSVIDKAILTSDPKYAVIVETDQSDTVVLKTMILTATGQFAGYITSIKRTPLTKKDLKNLVKYCK
jgi:hypothetical protein